jgi:hypothetical protein
MITTASPAAVISSRIGLSMDLVDTGRGLPDVAVAGSQTVTVRSHAAATESELVGAVQPRSSAVRSYWWWAPEAAARWPESVGWAPPARGLLMVQTAVSTTVVTNG